MSLSQLLELSAFLFSELILSSFHMLSSGIDHELIRGLLPNTKISKGHAPINFPVIVLIWSFQLSLKSEPFWKSFLMNSALKKVELNLGLRPSIGEPIVKVQRSLAAEKSN